MTDGEIAAAATYMRNAWGNRAPAVSPEQVRDLREKLSAERQPAVGSRTSSLESILAEGRRGHARFSSRTSRAPSA
jgi:hypothetical protein